MVAVVAPADAARAVKVLTAAGETVRRIGRIERRRKNAAQVVIV
jgi:phosphoribosylaminoimidazole (AIR) synthetase